MCNQYESNLVHNNNKRLGIHVHFGRQNRSRRTVKRRKTARKCTRPASVAPFLTTKTNNWCHTNAPSFPDSGKVKVRRFSAFLLPVGIHAHTTSHSPPKEEEESEGGSFCGGCYADRVWRTSGRWSWRERVHILPLCCHHTHAYHSSAYSVIGRKGWGRYIGVAGPRTMRQLLILSTDYVTN